LRLAALVEALFYEDFAVHLVEERLSSEDGSLRGWWWQLTTSQITGA
jgi:hypothetical protein